MLRTINHQHHLEYFPPIIQSNLEINHDRMNRFINYVVPLGQKNSHDQCYVPLNGHVITPTPQDLMSTRTEKSRTRIQKKTKRLRSQIRKVLGDTRFSPSNFVSRIQTIILLERSN